MKKRRMSDVQKSQLISWARKIADHCDEKEVVKDFPAMILDEVYENGFHDGHFKGYQKAFKETRSKLHASRMDSIRFINKTFRELKVKI